MRCPQCGGDGSRVLDSRPAEEGRSVRRRRSCSTCNRRFTTYERIDTTPMTVVKRDGSREQFDREKMLRGVLTACEKRAIPADRIHELINDVTRQLLSEADHEIQSVAIGERVMQELKELDEVAYVRFASVYRSFTDAAAFQEAVNSLKRNKEQTEEGKVLRDE